MADGDNVIGRAPDAGVWIDAPAVSRHHARIRLDEASAIMEDLGSKNGSYVRGQRLTTPSRLTDGEMIRLGPVVITFRILTPVGTTETARRQPRNARG